MPRDARIVLSLPLTELQAEMLAYVLEQAAQSEMPMRWAGAAIRLRARLLSTASMPAAEV